MRLVSAGNNPPREVDKYLLLHEREHQVITVRMHPAVLLAPVAIALAGLIAAVVLNGTVLKSSHVVMAATWSIEYFVVTSQRMILTSGLLTRKVAMMPLNKVTDMSFQRSLGGRLFGYGEFILESAGQDQALRNIPFIPYPEQLYLEVCDLLFPSKDAGDD